MTMTTRSRLTSPKPPFLATFMYGQLWIVWSPGCRELISATGNSIIISSKLFTDYSCWSSPPWRISPWVYLAVVWLVVLGENHWLHCTTIDGLIQVTKRIGFKDKKGVGRAGPGRELLGTWRVSHANTRSWLTQWQGSCRWSSKAGADPPTTRGESWLFNLDKYMFHSIQA